MPLDSRGRQIPNRAQLEATLKAVAYRTPGPIDREDALQDITLETPKAEGGDLLVKITAVSVNPVDTKLRLGVQPEGGDWRVLGFDAAGDVEAEGPEVQNFKPGDMVFMPVPSRGPAPTVNITLSMNASLAANPLA